MRTVLITGVAGFIGRCVAKEFAQNGWKTIGIDVCLHERAPLQHLSEYEPLVLPSDRLAPFIKRHEPEVCVHCAGPASIESSIANPQKDFDASACVTFDALNVIREYSPLCRFIYLSSAAVYGNPDSLPIREYQNLAPISPYGFHKLMSEQICREFSAIYGIKTLSLRIFSAYGPGLRRQVLWDICKKAVSDKTLFLKGTGYESRDFIHVDDVARATLFITESGLYSGEAYNLASGEETTIRDLANLVLLKLGKSIPVEFDMQPTAGAPRNWRADTGRLNVLGYAPRISLEKGVESYADWFKTEGEGK